MRRKRFRSLVLLALAVMAFGLVALAWSLWTYAEIVRLRVRVADACARVDAASEVRLGLVANLVQGARDFPVDESLGRLDRARDRAARLDPSRPFDPSGQMALRDAHRELTAALAEFWVEVGDVRRSAARAIVTDLRPELERAAATLEESLARMERDAGLYDRSIRGFPGSLVAGVAQIADGDRATPQSAPEEAGGAPLAGAVR